MSEEIKRGRGEPRKNATSNVIVETNTVQSSPTTDSTYEFNSYFGTVPMSELDTIFGCSISTAFTPEEIKMIIKDPIVNHSLTRKLAMFVYNSEGVVTNAIDYMVSLPCLDRVVYGKKRLFHKNKLNNNKDLMLSTLDSINDKVRPFIILKQPLNKSIEQNLCVIMMLKT